MYNWKGLTMYWKLPPDKRRKSTGFWQVSTNDLAPLQAFLTSTCEAILQSGHCHWIRANSEILSATKTDENWNLNKSLFWNAGSPFLLIFLFKSQKAFPKLVEDNQLFSPKKKMTARISGKPYDSFVMPVPSFNEPWIILSGIRSGVLLEG